VVLAGVYGCDCLSTVQLHLWGGGWRHHSGSAITVPRAQLAGVIAAPAGHAAAATGCVRNVQDARVPFAQGHDQGSVPGAGRQGSLCRRGVAQARGNGGIAVPSASLGAVAPAGDDASWLQGAGMLIAGEYGLGIYRRSWQLQGGATGCCLIVADAVSTSCADLALCIAAPACDGG